MKRAKIFVTHSVIDAELLGPLPGILEVEVDGIYMYRALRISYGDRRSGYVTGQIVSQRQRVGKLSAQIRASSWRGGDRRSTRCYSGPRALSAIEDELAGAAAMIKLIHT